MIEIRIGAVTGVALVLISCGVTPGKADAEQACNTAARADQSLIDDLTASATAGSFAAIQTAQKNAISKYNSSILKARDLAKSASTANGKYVPLAFDLDLEVNAAIKFNAAEKTVAQENRQKEYQKIDAEAGSP